MIILFFCFYISLYHLLSIFPVIRKSWLGTKSTEEYLIVSSECESVDVCIAEDISFEGQSEMNITWLGLSFRLVGSTNQIFIVLLKIVYQDTECLILSCTMCRCRALVPLRHASHSNPYFDSVQDKGFYTHDFSAMSFLVLYLYEPIIHYIRV